MNFPVVFLSGFALINTVASLECFDCEGPNCDTEIKLWNKDDCDARNPLPSHLWACLKETYRDGRTRQPAILRKCIQVDYNTRAYNCSLDRREGASCYVCRTNLCNSAPTYAILDAAILGALLRYLLV